MSSEFNLLLEVKHGIKAAANKPVFSSGTKGTPSGGAVFLQCGTHYLHRPPSLGWTCIKVAFVWQRAGHAYPYYTVTSGFPAEACKYQKGIICCRCRHTPGRHMPVSDFGEQGVSCCFTWAPIIYAGVRSNDYPGTEPI